MDPMLRAMLCPRNVAVMAAADSPPLPETGIVWVHGEAGDYAFLRPGEVYCDTVDEPVQLGRVIAYAIGGKKSGDLVQRRYWCLEQCDSGYDGVAEPFDPEKNWWSGGPWDGVVPTTIQPNARPVLLRKVKGRYLLVHFAMLAEAERLERWRVRNATPKGEARQRAARDRSRRLMERKEAEEKAARLADEIRARQWLKDMEHQDFEEMAARRLDRAAAAQRWLLGRAAHRMPRRGQR